MIETNSAPTTPEPDYTLDDRYLSARGAVLMTGVQALARLPIEQLRHDRVAGLVTAGFMSGYPGSPLGGLDMEVSRALRITGETGIVHQPGVNEELAATSVMGTQLVAGRPDATVDGVTGYWYGKSPGVDRATDALRLATFAGTSRFGGAVAIAGDDPANKSSTVPSTSTGVLLSLRMPLLYPGTVSECLELGLHAVALSRATGLWSALKIVTPVADGSATVDLAAFALQPVIPERIIDGTPYVCHPSGHLLGPGMIEVEREIHEIRIPLAREYGTLNDINRITADPSDAWTGIIASGYEYHETLQALRRLGLADLADLERAGIRMLQLRMPHPFDPDLVRRFASGLEQILVVEGKDGTLESLVRDALYRGADAPEVTGKHDREGASLVPSWGLVDADVLEPALRRVLAPRIAARLVPEPMPARERTLIPLAAQRSPYFCSGCPHNWSSKLPVGAEVGVGTGCSTMVLMMDDTRVGTPIGISAMGTEGTQWIGMSPFVEADHLFQNLGDGTYFHSGQLAIQAAVAAGQHMTFKLLVNGTVAMTGGQDAPGAVDAPEIATSLLAHGVARVAITTDDTARYRRTRLPTGVEVHDRTDIVTVQESLRETGGVTVLIHDQACAAETRRDRKRGRVPTPTTRVVINHRICEGCGDCGDVSNCLSVQPVDTPFGRKTTIDQASCNLDLSCLGGDCPAFMTVEVDDSGPGEAMLRSASPDRDDDSLPEPDANTIVGDVRLRLAGIGGTGVVTAAQIVQTAALLDGWQTRGLDQTGLSQKAGPVLSDIILSSDGHVETNHIGAGEAHVIIAFDSLVGAGDTTLTAAHPQRTALVASTHRIPTGHMVTHPTIAHPSETELAERFSTHLDPARRAMFDAHELAVRTTGSGTHANTVVLGAALQLGHVPVTVTSMYRAIELNGVAIDQNRKAFDAGRRWAVEQTPVEAPDNSTIASTQPSEAHDRMIGAIGAPSAVANTIVRLTADLVRYQNDRYANAYLTDVAAAARAERRAAGVVGCYTESVARNLHKLMAYKDEYEVARLMLLPEVADLAIAVGGPGARYAWQLHPPMLRALGLDRKLKIDGRLRPAVRALAAGKRLRGTRLDPFGRTGLRRAERALVDEYRDTLRVLEGHIDSSNIEAAAEIASLPDLVRGYESLKERRIEQYRSTLRQAMIDFTSPAASVDPVPLSSARRSSARPNDRET